MWQSLALQTDFDGNTLWQRVDAYRAQGAPVLGAPGWEGGSSASEYVMAAADGSLAFVQARATDAPACP